ncbi:hypothetical protein BDF14DRAFT_1749515 [Spinellus fusiger]|nr:hypothetical protein BDF14DRAFT_1749515 [Spinellus fusiger]
MSVLSSLTMPNLLQMALTFEILLDNDNLKMIIVDRLPFQNEIKLFKRNQLLTDSKTLEAFHCSVQKPKKQEVC